MPASLAAPGAFTAALTGLTPNTFYHYHAKAVGDGTAYGPDATFRTLPQYTLTTTITGDGTIDPPVGAHVYNSGTGVHLTASPSTGWAFKNWSGDVTGTTNALDIMMTANKTITANFVPVGTTLISAIMQNAALYAGMPVPSETECHCDAKRMTDCGNKTKFCLPSCFQSERTQSSPRPFRPGRLSLS